MTAAPARRSLILSARASRLQRLEAAAGRTGLLIVTLASVFAVLFIFYFIMRDALPFFRLRGLGEFFTSTRWYPSAAQPEFGAAAIFFGSALVTLGAAFVAMPLGVTAAVCLSDILPFSARQWAKPVIEMLAAIPSVAYGFIALVVVAPMLQTHGGGLIAAGVWIVGLPLGGLLVLVLSDMLSRGMDAKRRSGAQARFAFMLGCGMVACLYLCARKAGTLTVPSGTNALNVAVMLGIMALPTVVSVAEDALQAAGRDLREGSYALGATRAETVLRVVLPAAASGVTAAVILGVMRAVGETMVVWMASGNAAQIPRPWYNLLLPVRTLTATIAGDMGEADQVTGSARYHVLFAMALSLLAVSFLCNFISERLMWRTRKKLGA